MLREPRELDAAMLHDAMAVSQEMFINDLTCQMSI